MKNLLLILLFFSISFLILISCKSKPPIPEENFIKIYAGMTIMQDTSSLSQGKIRENVLSSFHYSENDYYKTIEYYNSDPEQWAKFFDNVIAYIENLKAKIKTKKTEPLALPKRYVLKDM